MHSTLRVTSFFAAIAALLVPLHVLFAQEAQPAPPAGTVFVQQTSDIQAVGVWTMLLPNHESFQRSDASLNVPNLSPGQYSFFTMPPKGTSTHIDLYLGDDIIASSETPQITFTVADKMTLKLVVKYSLSSFGKVGINSDPTGVPYELHGPDGMVKKGVTPAELSPSPIGNYSVTYFPQGCPQPPTKSSALTNNSRVDFMVQIVCANFHPVVDDSKPKTVSTELGGQTISFTDVASDAWYAPYVETVAKRGVMAGYSDPQGKSLNLFGPGDPVTVAQLAKIAHLLIKLDPTVTTAPLNPKARGQWYTPYIASAEDQGWLVYEDGTVDPDRPATRAEVVVTMLQAMDIPMHWAKGTIFNDVLRRTPYSSAIETAAANEIVSGTVDSGGTATGEFHPNDPITRAEIAKILIVLHEKYQQ